MSLPFWGEIMSDKKSNDKLAMAVQDAALQNLNDDVLSLINAVESFPSKLDDFASEKLNETRLIMDQLLTALDNKKTQLPKVLSNESETQESNITNEIANDLLKIKNSLNNKNGNVKHYLITFLLSLFASCLGTFLVIQTLL